MAGSELPVGTANPGSSFVIMNSLERHALRNTTNSWWISYALVEGDHAPARRVQRDVNVLFLKDLAEKMHRGLRGRVESGKAGGGLCYGYRVVRTMNGMTVSTGEREIEPTEAAIVERIFREFVSGRSPKQIAKRLIACAT